MSRLLSVIIPVYNEERTIELLLEKVLKAYLPDGLQKEIIVVNDGSTDNTLTILKQYTHNPQVKVFSKLNGGKASAIKHGMAQTSGDIILIQDADLEYDPNQYSQLLRPILDGKTQIIYGSRFLGKIKKMRLINRVANVISNWTMYLLWGQRLTDINTCYKVFTKEAISGVDIRSKNFAFETEVTIKFIKKGLRIIEVPIMYQARSRQEGKKINWRTAMEMYWPIIAYHFVRH